MMTKIDYTKIKGYGEIKDLLKTNSILSYKFIWKLDFFYEANEFSDLIPKLIIELSMTKDPIGFSTIKLLISNPTLSNLFPLQQITDLAIYNLKDDGWGNAKYKIFDMEQDTDWEILCTDFKFERGSVNASLYY